MADYIDYHSKRTGEQVEALLDIVAQGGTGGEGGEVQKTTEAEIAAMGFTKNTGTITEVKMNGVSKGTSGTVDLGTVITSHQDISGKVDKVDGKQLSTEDFTTALKQKLEGLSNYDDTAINETVSALQQSLNTLLNGNPNDAINSFNEIISFLDGVKDSQDLSSIIASIEQQIAGKQDVIADLASIRSGAEKGATALQEHQPLKTINGQSIIGSGNITIEGGSSSGEDIRYFTNFTVERVKVSAYVGTMIEETAIELINAARSNKLICVPYADADKGYIVASYRFVDGDMHDLIFIGEMFEGGVVYRFAVVYRGEEVGLGVRGIQAQVCSPQVEEVIVFDGVADIAMADNSIYITSEPVEQLTISNDAEIIIGSTVRFCTGEDCSIELYDVYWANGAVPTIEPYTQYELSLTTNSEWCFNAVLTPFKPA